MELDLEAKEEFEQKFRVISLLGKGSFGFVYECEDKVDNQTYAVKVPIS
jgi:serine/threonine protein kinase